MEQSPRVLTRLLLMTVGYFGAACASAVVGVIVGRYIGYGNSDSAVWLLLVLNLFTMLPAAIGILVSEAYAIRSWLFHVLNTMGSAWFGWFLLAAAFGSTSKISWVAQLAVFAGGIAGGFIYWAVAGSSAGFCDPLRKRKPAPTAPTADTRKPSIYP